MEVCKRSNFFIYIDDICLYITLWLRGFLLWNSFCDHSGFRTSLINTRTFLNFMKSPTVLLELFEHSSIFDSIKWMRGGGDKVHRYYCFIFFKCICNTSRFLACHDIVTSHIEGKCVCEYIVFTFRRYFSFAGITVHTFSWQWVYVTQFN